MRASDLVTLLDYSCWARDRVLAAAAKLTPEQYVKPMGNSFSSVRDTIVHLYAAEWIWVKRILGELPVKFPPPETFPDVASVRAAWAETEQKLRAFVGALDDGGVDRVVEYQTLSYGPGSSTIAQIIQHVVNHGSYHRGQVTTMIRQLGGEPAKGLDLILYFRERDQGRDG
ncbi:MAG TPA: DinB family protein [Gemmatimonadaceae bacterium]|nr:DinB family protein [Gemmatimonadaceae bacterium]